MNAASSGRAAFPANMSLARRGAVQSTPFVGLGQQSFTGDQVAQSIELSKGYLVSKPDFSEALRTQHQQTAQDMREMGFHSAADRADERLGGGRQRVERDN